MSHRVVTQPAFILHRRPYGNTSWVLELLCRDFGRVGALAKGVRGARSRTQSILQPLRPLLVSWVGKGDLKTLTGVEEWGSPLQPASPTVYASAFYLNELTLRLLPREDPLPELFDAYQGALGTLGQSAAVAAVAAALRRYEKRLLAATGYGLSLVATATGSPIDPGASYGYRLNHGPVPWNEAEPTDIAISGKSLLALDGDHLDDPGVAREARRLLRAAIAVQLEGRPLVSQRLVRRPAVAIDSSP
ncbi:MAG: DNA repair protein RecO [Candidatus Competibacterales bacterium]